MTALLGMPKTSPVWTARFRITRRVPAAVVRKLGMKRVIELLLERHDGAGRAKSDGEDGCRQTDEQMEAEDNPAHAGHYRAALYTTLPPMIV